MKKLGLILIGVLVLAAAGWFVFNKYGVDPKPKISTGKVVDVTGQLVQLDAGYEVVKQDLSSAVQIMNSANVEVEKTLQKSKGKTVHVYGIELDSEKHAIVLLWMNNRKLTDEQNAMQVQGAKNPFSTTFNTFTDPQKECIRKEISGERMSFLQASETSALTAEDVQVVNSCLIK